MNISEAKIGLEVVRSKGDKTGTKGSQGMFPVGSECAKKLVIQFAF